MDKKQRELWGRITRELNFVARVSGPTHAIQSKPNERIQHLRPHYTNELFKNAQTVYLAKGYSLSGEYVKGAAYNYSDRYRLWFSDELYTAAWAAAKVVDKDLSTAASIEAFLRHIHGDAELTLVHIMAGFNMSNGYDYQVYGFIPGKEE